MLHACAKRLNKAYVIAVQYSKLTWLSFCTDSCVDNNEQTNKADRSSACMHAVPLRQGARAACDDVTPWLP